MFTGAKFRPKEATNQAATIQLRPSSEGSSIIIAPANTNATAIVSMSLALGFIASV